MASDDRRAAALERASGQLLDRLRRGVERHGGPRSRLLALWDVLEAWLASGDAAATALAEALASPVRNGGPASHSVLAHHRLALRRLLEELARATGAPDPGALATQLELLVEGTIVGAMVDRGPLVARHARELTALALDAAGV
jgi:hypothetical protein